MSAAPGEPIDLAALTAAHFQACIKQDFTLVLPEGARLTLTLDEVAPERMTAPGSRRAAFSLLFRCAELPPGRYLRQGCYRIENPLLGAMELLITPVTPDAGGMCYQAVFG